MAQRRAVFALLIVILAVFAGCGEKNSENKNPAEHTAQASVSSEVEPAAEITYEKTELTPVHSKWAIYWYLCGSDLESFYGCATDDLAEMLNVELPEDVRVVIQSGGCRTWHTAGFTGEKIQRRLYSSGGLELIEELPSADMGKAETLSSFLAFCSEYYPADHKAVVFWNHGGGSVSGAAFDEIYNYNSLLLSEFRDAFSESCQISEENPPFDIVGFDACLMATVDTAESFIGIADYLIASEELEPANGWNYQSIFETLAADPDIVSQELGVAVCDAYGEGCRQNGTDGEITISLTDLRKAGKLIDAYNNFGDEALCLAAGDPAFLAQFGRMAELTENYGGNTPEQGYSNMADLGHLARNCTEILPLTSGQVIDALDECVVYRVSGPYRSEASGLSCYYSYDGDMNDFIAYTGEGSCEAFKYLYAYELVGALSDAGHDYAASISPDDLKPEEIPLLADFDESDYSVYVDDYGYAHLSVSDGMSEVLRSVEVRVSSAFLEDNAHMLWGSDNLMDMDWENGSFRSWFSGFWGCLNGYPVYMELVCQSDDYDTYSIPILLNGTLCNLRTVYDYDDGEYHILGAREGIDPDTGMADKNLVQLTAGDDVVPVYYINRDITGENSAWEFYAPDEFAFTWDDGMEFDILDFGTGLFFLQFDMTGVRGDHLLSPFIVSSIGGEYGEYMLTQTLEDALAGKENVSVRYR